MSFNESTLFFIQTRANFRCEYCRRKLSTGEKFEIEHILPKAKGGQNSKENLAYSCSKCNNNKREFINFIDPISGLTFPLFNPRLMKWEDHFKINQITNEISGITSIGRATAHLLFKYTRQVILPDIQWNDIKEYKNSDSIIYDVINKLRVSLFQNKFTLIQESVDNINTLISPEVLNKETNLEFVLEKLKLESYYTKSTELNINEGIKYAYSLLKKYENNTELRLQVFNILSIIFQQKSTSELLLGNKKWASLYLKKAYNTVSYVTEVTNQLSLRDDDYIFNMEAKFRKIKWGTSKYSINIKNDLISYHKELKEESSEAQFRGLKFIADLLLINEKINFDFLEKIFEETTSFVSESGYGNTYNITHAVGLRRRWWGLCFIYEKDINYDLLRNDLNYWKKMELNNEIREIKIWHLSIINIINKDKWNDINSVLIFFTTK